MVKRIPVERSNLSYIFSWDGQYLTELWIVVSYLARDVVLEVFWETSCPTKNCFYAGLKCSSSTGLVNIFENYLWGRLFVIELQVCNRHARFWGKNADRQFISENTQEWSSIFSPAKVFLYISLHLSLSHQSNQMKLSISRIYLRIKSANDSIHFMQLVKYDSNCCYAFDARRNI